MSMTGPDVATPDQIPLSGSILAPAASGSVVLERLPDGSVQVELAMSGSRARTQATSTSCGSWAMSVA